MQFSLTPRVRNIFLAELIVATTILTNQASAQYEEWYLDCTIVQRTIPDELSSSVFKDLTTVKLYMPFDNGGNLGFEGTKITYTTDLKWGHDLTPLSFFDRVCFNKGKSLVTGVVTWHGTEPRSFLQGWTMTGELLVTENHRGAIYTETFFRNHLARGSIVNRCVFNNPN